MPEIKKMKFIAAMKDFFGFKPGQTLGEFMSEIKTLDDADRDYFKRGLAQNHYEVEA